MRYVFPISILFVALLFAGTAEAGIADTSGTDSVREKLEKAGELHMTGKEEESLEIYNEILEEEEDNLEALWNAAVLYAKRGFRKEREAEIREDYDRALELAEKAVEHHDEGHAYYAKAVAMSRQTELMGRRDKIKASHEIKEHLEKAADRIPDFAPVWHLYGVWHSDVANVSGAGKRLAGLFTKGVPDASNDTAEEYLKKAVEMNEENILFRLDLARHYLEVDKNREARKELETLTEMDPKMKDDPEYLKEAEKLLQEVR